MGNNNLRRLFHFLLSFSIVSFIALFTFSTPALATTILLDPGHSAISKGVYDDPYGIYDDDYPNTPEITEAMDIANWLNKKLTADGYNVIMTKNTWNSPSFFSLWDRAQKANNANVDLAVSIHDDHTQHWSNFAQVYFQRDCEPQMQCQYRINKNGKKIYFSDTAVAKLSTKYASTFVTERQKAEGHTVVPTDANFAGRGAIASGNIPQVQLYAKVPWIYNEVGGQGIDISKYEQGILNAIEKAVPSNGSGNNGGDTATSNCVITAVGNAPANPALPAPCISGTASGGGNQSVVQLGEKYINNPKYLYIWGGPSGGDQTNNPNGFDCSGFTGWIWYHATNGKVTLPRTTSAMWNTAAASKLQKFLPSQISQVQPGDLLLFEGGDVPPEPGHVGVYTGDNKCSGGKMCYMEFASSGQPGDYASLNVNGTGVSKFFGFLRPMQ